MCAYIRNLVAVVVGRKLEDGRILDVKNCLIVRVLKKYIYVSFDAQVKKKKQWLISIININIIIIGFVVKYITQKKLVLYTGSIWTQIAILFIIYSVCIYLLFFLTYFSISALFRHKIFLRR